MTPTLTDEMLLSSTLERLEFDFPEADDPFAVVNGRIIKSMEEDDE